MSDSISLKGRLLEIFKWMMDDVIHYDPKLYCEGDPKTGSLDPDATDKLVIHPNIVYAIHDIRLFFAERPLKDLGDNPGEILAIIPYDSGNIGGFTLRTQKKEYRILVIERDLPPDQMAEDGFAPVFDDPTVITHNNPRWGEYGS